MRHARSSPPTAVALAIAVGLSGLAAGGCYRPNIKDGGFKCNLDAGAAHFCPEGYTCDLALDQCWKGPHGDGGPGGTPGTDARDTGSADVPDVGLPCFVPMAGCDPAEAGVCDPFCQSGCSGCRQKCTVDQDGGIGCQVVTSATPNSELQNCGNNATRSDDCGPGLVCLKDNCSSKRCYRFCRVDADCPSSFCSRTAPGGLSVCDVPTMDGCNPVGATNPGCPSSVQGCYLSFNHPEHTVCDCTGSGSPNSSCTASQSCLPGNLCVNANGLGPECLPVCQLDGGTGCQSGAPCQVYTGSDVSNPPNPKFGFCF